jgi:membrane associated rhomboid family serine protease
MNIPRTATVAIAALLVLAFLVAGLFAGAVGPALTMGFIPARWGGADVPWASIPAILTPLSATLVHADVLHLGFNLLILLWCGSAVERVLGKGALLLLLGVGAYTAAVAQWLVDPSSIVPGIGASGAISAVIGAFALSFSKAKQLTRSVRLNRLINAAWLLAAWVAMQVLIGLMAGLQGILLGTAAHVGGFVAGLLMQCPLLLWRYRKA